MNVKKQEDVSLINYTENCQAGFKDVWQYLMAFKVTMLFIFLAMIGFSLAALCLPILVEDISHAIAQNQFHSLVVLSMLVLVFFIGRGGLNFLQNVLAAKVALNVVNRIRHQAFVHVLGLDIRFYSGARLGDLSYRLSADVDALATMIEQCFQQAVPALLTLIVLIVYLCYLNWMLTLFILVSAPIFGQCMSILGKKIFQYSKLAQQSVANVSSYLAEFITGVKVIKTFAKERYVSKQFEQVSTQYRDRKLTIQLVMALQWPMLGLLQGLCVLIIMLASGYCIHKGILTIPQFLGYVTAVALLVDPIQKIAQNYSAIKQWQASIRRVFCLFDIPP